MNEKQRKELAAAFRAAEEWIASDVLDMANGKMPDKITRSQVAMHGAHLVIAQSVLGWYQLQLLGENFHPRTPKSSLILPA